MVVIFPTLHYIWPWEKNSPVPLHIMGYFTVNVFYDVLINSQFFSYPVRSQIKIQKTHVKQYVLMSIEAHHAVQCMVDDHTNNAQ